MTEPVEIPLEVVNEEPVFDSTGLPDEPEDLTKQTVLHNRYTFWFHRRGQQAKGMSYEESMKNVSSFQTVEHFWRIYDHMIRPNDIKSATTDYHLFKDGIKPTWEDPANKNGGKWTVHLKKGLASRYWEDIVLAIIGEQFDVGHEICGAVLSVRNSEDIISVWNKTTDNMEATNKIRDQMKRFLKLPAFIPIEYKKHQDSLTDNSSYRNPTVVWRAPSSRARENGEGNTNNNAFGARPPGYNSNSQYANRGAQGQAGYSPRGGAGAGHDHSPRNTGESVPGGFSREQSPRGSANEGGNRWDGQQGQGQHSHHYQQQQQQTSGYGGTSPRAGSGNAWKPPPVSTGDPVRDKEVNEKNAASAATSTTPSASTNAWGKSSHSPRAADSQATPAAATPTGPPPNAWANRSAAQPRVTPTAAASSTVDKWSRGTAIPVPVKDTTVHNTPAATSDA